MEIHNEFVDGEPIEILKMLFVPFVKRLVIERFYSPIEIIATGDLLEEFVLTDIVGRCDVTIQSSGLKEIEFNRVSINSITWISGNNECIRNWTRYTGKEILC